MNIREQRLINRLQELILEARSVAGTISHDEYGYNINHSLYNSWLAKSKNIIVLVFGDKSHYFTEFNRLINDIYNHEMLIPSLEGILVGAKNDLENGFVIGQEFIIAGEIFDSVLEESKHLNKSGHIEASAILGRVVLEDSLKRIARSIGINDNQKASVINDALKSQNVYTQPQWRQIQVYFDIGNAAAHGKFQEYDKKDVDNMLSGIEQFMINNFTCK